MTHLTANDASVLRASVNGPVLLPDDSGYDEARALSNGMIDHRPAALARVTGPADVAAALRFAQDRGLSVSVKGGGHGAAGHATAGDLVIDLAGLRSVAVDPLTKTAVVGGGALWGDVDPATQAYGLAVPGGRVTHTGVGGLTLGGGEGWLSKRYGLTVDNLRAVELVTADGRTLTVDADHEPELFWALRGGGGNFGVATSFTFDLHEVGPLVLGGLLLYPLEALADVLAVVEELTTLGRDELGIGTVVMAAPPAPFVPSELHFRTSVVVVPSWCGDIDEGQKLIDPLRTAVTPLVDAAGPMPYTALQAQLDPGNPLGLRTYWSTSMTSQRPSSFVDVLAAAADVMPTPLSNIIIAHAGGAIARVPDDATAFPARSVEWLIHPVARGFDPAQDDGIRTWSQGLAGKLREVEETTYLNTDVADDARVRWAFGADRYARLQAVKRAFDPDNVFRHCANVRPA